jgi:hypothetical protein
MGKLPDLVSANFGQTLQIDSHSRWLGENEMVKNSFLKAINR